MEEPVEETKSLLDKVNSLAEEDWKPLSDNIQDQTIHAKSLLHTSCLPALGLKKKACQRNKTNLH